MESLQFEYPASVPAQSRTLAGVVGSGDLEVLVEPGSSGHTKIVVNTSVDGSGHHWQALLKRIFEALPDEPAMKIEINDFGATPGVVRMRLEQAIEQIRQIAGK